MENDLKNSTEVLKELTTKIHQDSKTWLQHVLLLASSLFGILISLHNNNSPLLYIRLCFALALVLLGFGILGLSIALYARLDVLIRTRKAYALEAGNAYRERRSISYVSVSSRKVFDICETIGYIFLVACLLLLSLYSVLICFF